MPHTHEERNDLAGEHRLTDIGQIIGLVLFAVVWITDSFVLKFTVFAASIVPSVIRIPLAFALMVLGGAMAYVSHRQIFKEVRNPPVIVDAAFYRYVRHPMYLSEILTYLGLFLLSFSLASLAVIVAVFIFFSVVTSTEEKKLEAVFGDAYHQYRLRTGRWLPRLIRGR